MKVVVGGPRALKVARVFRGAMRANIKGGVGV
jgi:hypothetical protein